MTKFSHTTHGIYYREFTCEKCHTEIKGKFTKKKRFCFDCVQKNKAERVKSLLEEKLKI